MSAIGSVGSTVLHQAPPTTPTPPVKTDSDGDHDNSPPSEAASTGSSRALNIVA
jgi:hypothetical protein